MLQSSPLTKWGSGAEIPWHCRQFIPGEWLGGLGAAVEWLGMLWWHTKQPLSLEVMWQDRQWRLRPVLHIPVWFRGAVSM